MKRNAIVEIYCLIQQSPFDVRTFLAFWLPYWATHNMINNNCKWTEAEATRGFEYI